MAEDKKLGLHQALFELHQGLKERVTAFEQQCLELRKAEQAVAANKLVKNATMGYGSTPPVPGISGGAAMTLSEKKSSLCKLCDSGSCDCAKAESYAKGELTGNARKDLIEPCFDGVLPGDKKPKDAAGDDGSGGDIKKNAMPGLPKPAAPKPPGAGAAAGTMKGPGLPKPPAPKPPGAGAPNFKAEVAMGKKALVPGAALNITPIASSPVKPGPLATPPAVMPKAAPVQTMVERVASRVPAKKTVTLPGAHLFGAPLAMKSEQAPNEPAKTPDSKPATPPPNLEGKRRAKRIALYMKDEPSPNAAPAQPPAPAPVVTTTTSQNLAGKRRAKRIALYMKGEKK